MMMKTEMLEKTTFIRNEHFVHPQRRNACRRCGACCRKGGPALHVEDAETIQSGQIPLKFLLTIRQGEPAFDNIQGLVQPAVEDIIIVKARTNSTACVFFDTEATACGIYEYRPLECRVLKCWDTDAITACYRRQRLGRKDLLAEVDGLWDLITAHQAYCDYGRLSRLVGSMRGSDQQNDAQEINEMIRYDGAMREQISNKGAIDRELLEFLLGRPMIQTIRMFGIRMNTATSRIEPFPAPMILSAICRD